MKLRKNTLILGCIALALLVGAGIFGVSSLLNGSDAPVISMNADVSSEPPIAQTVTPEQTNVPEPTQTPVAVARIRAVGDIIIDTPMLKNAYSKGSYKFGKYFARMAKQLEDADLTIANIEGCLAGIGNLGYAGYPSFNTPPSILGALKACGVDMLTLANNHSLDRYFSGLMGTLKSVDQSGLLRTGAYRSKKEYDKPLVVDVNGIKLGITNYTNGLNQLEKKSDKRALSYGIRTTMHANFEKDMQALRDAGAQAIVVFMHWDREYKHLPSEETKGYAKRLIAAGADVIIGGHAHMVQPIEYVESEHRRGLVVYSMGNFLSNHKGDYLDNGILFEISFALDAAGGVTPFAPKYMPVGMWVQKGEDNINYQVMPVGQTIDNPPEEMSIEQIERFKAMWKESFDLLGDEIAEPIRG